MGPPRQRHALDALNGKTTAPALAGTVVFVELIGGIEPPIDHLTTNIRLAI